MNPIISIIVPTFRRPEKLERALESINNSIGCTHEAIVIDDCLEGSGFDSARKFGARYIHKAGIDRGQSFSRNIGITLARGRWIAFLDDDDFFLPEGIDSLIDAAQTSNASLLFGNYQAFNKSTRTDVNLDKVNQDTLLVCNQIPMGAFILERSAIRGWFDTRMRSHEDWDFILSQLAHTELRHVPTSVVAIDKTENQTTSTEARRRHLFWLDFISVYARFPAMHLAQTREGMLTSLGIQMPQGSLKIDDIF